VTVMGHFQTTQSELLTLKGQFQTQQSKLYILKSNHTKLLRWSMDMGKVMKAIGKWITKNTRANIMGQDRLSIVEEII
jgi:hypothetical protein